MRKLEQNFKYFIILLIILILGILIFGNYNLNLSLIESYTINTTKDSLTKQSEKTYKHKKIGEDLTNFVNNECATHETNHYNGINTENIK